MAVLNISCHNLLGTNRPKVGCELTGRGYETSEPGHESPGYETTGKLWDGNSLLFRRVAPGGVIVALF